MGEFVGKRIVPLVGGSVVVRSQSSNCSFNAAHALLGPLGLGSQEPVGKRVVPSVGLSVGVRAAVVAVTVADGEALSSGGRARCFMAPLVH